jgi:hypothetical protein
MNPSEMILIAGPYRSGTGDDPDKMAANLQRLEQVALQIYARGHLPVIGEWLAVPLARQAGSRQVGDSTWEAYGYPTADRLLEFCTAVLRIEGESRGAEGDLEVARRRGLKVYFNIDDIPMGTPQPGRFARGVRTP